VQLGQSNGWILLADTIFIDQFNRLSNKVERLQQKNPSGYKSTNSAKKLAAITRLVTEIIPADPAATEFRLGKTLPQEYRHWRRAKFFQQYRLFFRYDSKSRVIIYSWFNDDENLRAYESQNDAYITFKKMLAKGKPPSSWIELLESTKSQ
jgi:toxin YhaV